MILSGKDLINLIEAKRIQIKARLNVIGQFNNMINASLTDKVRISFKGMSEEQIDKTLDIIERSKK